MCERREHDDTVSGRSQFLFRYGSLPTLLVLAYLIPGFCYLALVLAAFTVLLCLRSVQTRWGRILVYVGLLLIVLRTVGLIAIIWTGLSDPPPRSIHHCRESLGALAWFAQPDAGLMEGLIWRFEEKTIDLVGQVSSTQGELLEELLKSGNRNGVLQKIADPYSTTSGLLWRKREDTLITYSIGPDREDHRGEIVFDPTNGVGSVGDIVGTYTRPSSGQPTGAE